MEGGSLYFEVLGDGAAIVLIHGAFGDRRMWDDQFEALAAEFRVIRYDHRGFGQSTLPEAAYSPVADLLRLLDHLDIPKAHLVGNSLGGTLALDFTLEHPSRVASLVMVAAGPNGYEVPEEDRNRINAVFAAAEEQGIEPALELWLSDPMLAATNDNADVRERVRMMATENSRVFRMQFWPSEPIEPPALQRLSEVAVPTLIIVGERDTPLIHAMSEAVSQGISGARIVTIAGADHLPQMEKPDEFNRIVTTFLGSQEAVAAGYVQVDGSELFYETRGEGQTLVLIHDGLLHRESWDAQFEAFAEYYRVIRYDRRGYGRSPMPTQEYSHIEDLYALLYSLAPDSVILAAISSGGAIAIEYTLAHPERVEALVLVGAVVGGLGFTDHFVERGADAVELAQEGRDIPKVIDYWVSDPYLIAPMNTTAKQRLRQLLTTNPQDLQTPYNLVRWPDEPALERLGEIGVPTLIIVGEYDIPDVHAHAGAIDAGIPGAKRVIIDDAGHLAQLEQPDAFNQLVLGFLRGDAN